MPTSKTIVLTLAPNTQTQNPATVKNLLVAICLQNPPTIPSTSPPTQRVLIPRLLGLYQCKCWEISHKTPQGVVKRLEHETNNSFENNSLKNIWDQGFFIVDLGGLRRTRAFQLKAFWHRTHQLALQEQHARVLEFRKLEDVLEHSKGLLGILWATKRTMNDLDTPSVSSQ